MTTSDSARYDVGKQLSGWWAYAAVMMLIVGGFNLIDGIAALAQKEYFNESGLLYENLKFWGWIVLIIGIIQILVSILIFMRSTAGAVLGIIIAVVSAIFAFLSIGAYPLWSIAVLVVDGLVIYGLTRSSTTN
jgi:hypothetical protein